MVSKAHRFFLYQISPHLALQVMAWLVLSPEQKLNLLWHVSEPQLRSVCISTECILTKEHLRNKRQKLTSTEALHKSRGLYYIVFFNLHSNPVRYSHFTDENSETQRDEAISSSHKTSKGWRWLSNPRLILKFMFLDKQFTSSRPLLLYQECYCTL
jgi:hypothetical protein